MLGLKCKDIGSKRTLRIERGVGKQVVDDVKSSASAGVMAIADEVLKVKNGSESLSSESRGLGLCFTCEVGSPGAQL